MQYDLGTVVMIIADNLIGRVQKCPTEFYRVVRLYDPKVDSFQMRQYMIEDLREASPMEQLQFRKVAADYNRRKVQVPK